MKWKAVPYSWIERWGMRLDTAPYMGGAVEARFKLDAIRNRKDHLRDITLGIINAGRIKRLWVEDPQFGTPFLSSTDILRADLSNISLISNKAVAANPNLIIREGWTLITRAGTVGRMAYARPDMDRMACTEDVLRVIPNTERIRAGYLYAFLSSRFGVPLVTSGTYGAIIQHIEPEHIADLPVPRLGDSIERTAHELVEKAASCRAYASKNRAKAIKIAIDLIQWQGMPSHQLHTTAKASRLERRMDAFHHSTIVSHSREALATHRNSKVIGENVSVVFEPNRGARMKVEDPAFGVPFLSSSEVFRLDPQGEYLISKKHTPHLETLLVTNADLLVPRSGQIGGIIGRAVMPLPTYYEHAASEHLVRIRCYSFEDACYLWAVLASEPGYWATVGTAFGSSIPSLDTELISNLAVPWVLRSQRQSIISLVAEGIKQQEIAIHSEREAVALVEAAIEEAA